MYLLIISQLFVVAVVSLFYLNVFTNHFSLFVVAVASLFYLNVFINRFSIICSCCSVSVLS